MELNIQPTTRDEMRYLSHPEFAQRLLAHGVTQVTFEYEDGEPEGRISNLSLLDASGHGVGGQVPALLREALMQRIEANCLCHYQGRYIDCGPQLCLWDLTAESSPAG